MSLYYDGDFSEATQDGPIVPSIDDETRSLVWKQPMIQRAGLWVPLNLDTPAPGWPEGFLTKESDPSPAGGDLIKWDRIFHAVPATYFEPVEYSYTYPFPLEDGSVGESTVSTTATMEYAFFLVRDPTREIPMRYRLRSNTFLSIEEYLERVFDEDLVIVMDDSKITRWNGNIWRRATPLAPKATLIAAGIANPI